MAVARRDGKLPQAKSFFTMTAEELYSGTAMMNGSRNSGAFVRFLMLGGAKKNAKFKPVFADYVKAIVFAVDERTAKAAKDRKTPGAGAPEGFEEPKSEKEEDEMNQKRAQAWTQQERQFLDEVFQRVFSQWTVKDWDALTAAYWKDTES